MKFADKLQSLMTERGVSRTKLSELTGINKSSISQYLSGKNQPTMARKRDIAMALGVDADYFNQQGQGGANPLADTANLPVMVAAKLMGKSKEFVYQGLQDGRFPWGWAVWMGSSWSYYISPIAFARYTGLTIQ